MDMYCWKTNPGIPKEEEDFVSQLRARGAQVPNTTGWVAMDCYSLNSRITEMEQLGVIKRGTKVLDLGCGCGTSTAVWAFRGYHCVGVEINKELAAIGMDACEEVNARPELRKSGFGTMRIVEASYYPREYIRRRQAGETLALPMESMVTSSHYHPVCPVDMTEEFGISWADFDILYIWLWQEQTFSVSEVLANYARDDAVLLAFNAAPFNSRILGVQHHPYSKSAIIKGISPDDDRVDEYPECQG